MVIRASFTAMILAGYFCRRVAVAVGLLWLSLTVLIVILETLGEFDNAPLSVALTLALLHMPRLAIETLPFACAIGAAAALRQMDEKRELQTMRAAGLSLARLAVLAAGGGVIFTVVLTVLSETILEPAESLARVVRGDISGRGNLWLEHHGDFFHARRLLADGGLSEVTIYRPSAQKLMVVSAHSAQRQKDGLLLTDGYITELNRDAAPGTAQLSQQPFTNHTWPFPAAATVESLQAIARRPREMSLRTLLGVSHLEQNAGGARYAAALWRRFWSLFAPPLLTAGGVWVIGQSRQRRILSAVLVATVLVGAYYFTAVICAQFAALFHLPVVNIVPLLLLVVVVILGARRRFA